MTGDPGITLAEGRPLRPPYYTIKADSPILDKGETTSVGAIDNGVALTIPPAIKESDDE